MPACIHYPVKRNILKALNIFIKFNLVARKPNLYNLNSELIKLQTNKPGELQGMKLLV